MHNLLNAATLFGIIGMAIKLAMPYLYAGLGELFDQAAGVFNLGTEGIMLIGAFSSFYVVYLTGNSGLGILAAILSGFLMALLMAVISITFKAPQGISGIGLTMFGTGLSSLLFKTILEGTVLSIDGFPNLPLPLLSKIPWIGPILFDQNILTYGIYILLPISAFILYRTSWGLTIRSTGENPEAVDVAGISVNRVRFLMVLLSGVMGGIAGSFYSIGYLGMFADNIIGGRGWIAFAICFLGNWNPKGALVGTIVFGLAEALAIYMQSLGGQSFFPNELFIALPYLLTIALTITRRSFNVPAKLGEPYIKEN